MSDPRIVMVFVKVNLRHKDDFEFVKISQRVKAISIATLF